MSEDCIICFESIGQHGIGCGNPDCMTRMCVQCTDRLIDICSRESQMPGCSNPNCNAHLLYPDLKPLSAGAKATYCDLLSKHLMKEPSVQAVRDTSLIVEQLRNEKREFIEKNFSRAVNLVIDIAMAKQLRKIDKSNQQKIKNILSKSSRCMNFLCKGFLDAGFRCMTCDTLFCKKCEKKISSQDHVCKEEDVASLGFVQQLVKCPQCKSPVLRSWGCNAITCALCRTNFDYVTGRRCAAGNHTNDEKVVLTTPATLSALFLENKQEENEKQIGILQLLGIIDDIKPVDYSYANVANLVNKQDSNKTLATKYAKYVRVKYNIKRYQACVNKIEELIQSDGLTKVKLEEILFHLRGG